MVIEEEMWSFELAHPVHLCSSSTDIRSCTHCTQSTVMHDILCCVVQTKYSVFRQQMYVFMQVLYSTYMLTACTVYVQYVMYVCALYSARA